jgi:hypothetical protein
LLWTVSFSCFLDMNKTLTLFFIWIQRWRIDTRNSFKLSSETCWIDANVLEETASTTSCIFSLYVFVFLFFVFLHFTHNSTIWFVSSLIEMLIGFWNDLCNFETIESFSYLWKRNLLIHIFYFQPYSFWIISNFWKSFIAQMGLPLFHTFL